jgi:hypothetical protein
MTPGIYRHHDGGLFVVMAVCIDTTQARGGERVVLFYSLTHQRLMVRDVVEFNELIRWPDGKLRPRFEPVGSKG